MKLQELTQDRWFDIVNINGNLSSVDINFHSDREYYFTGAISTDWVFVPNGNENDKNYVMQGVDGSIKNATQLR